jgi:hypothetical protein
MSLLNSLSLSSYFSKLQNNLVVKIYLTNVERDNPHQNPDRPYYKYGFSVQFRQMKFILRPFLIWYSHKQYILQSARARENHTMYLTHWISRSWGSWIGNTHLTTGTTDVRLCIDIRLRWQGSQTHVRLCCY